MDSIKVTLICMLINLPAIAALQCLKCNDYFLDTDNRAAQNSFRQPTFGPSPAEEPACREPVGRSSVSMEDCDDTPQGVGVCSLTTGSGTYVYNGESLTVNLTLRGCNNIEASKKGKCERSIQSNFAFDMRNVEMKTCYCSGENANECNSQSKPSPTLAVFFLILVAFFILKE